MAFHPPTLPDNEPEETPVTDYAPLTPETLPARLGGLPAVAGAVGGDPAAWRVEEVGDGNLNLVFIVEGSAGSVIVKQALPYVRLVGDSWPLPLYRAFYEHHALVRQEARDPGAVPEVLSFDEDQALIVMELLKPHVILRRKMIAGERVEGLGPRLGEFCARTAFRGSELSMRSADKKADVALFAGNVEIPAITEALVFTDPYYPAEMNHHTEGLDPVVSLLRADAEMKAEVGELFLAFASNAETMLHGDLHTGSIMATGTEAKIIDPEFAQYGPMGFDLGMLIANYLMAYFSQPGHRSGAALDGFQAWIIDVIDETRGAGEREFARLWETERTGMLFPRALFEDQGQPSTDALRRRLAAIRAEAFGYAGIEMHRRVLSLAHNADFEDIADPAIRAPLEARNLMMGRALIRERRALAPGDIRGMAGRFNREDAL